MQVQMSLLVLLLVGGASALHCTGECQHGDANSIMDQVRVLKDNAWAACEGNCAVPCHGVTGEAQECTDGFVGEYACSNMDLLAMIPLRGLGSALGARANDIWGWTDPLTNREYVITGQMDGTSFVDISDPVNPLVLAFLPSHICEFERQSWRDMKVYKDHVFIVGDRGDHGMQIFDLTRLRGMHENYSGIKRLVFIPPTDDNPGELAEDAFYDEFGTCHNLAINEESGYAYCIGSDTCNGGPHMIDIQDPLNPQFVGCAGGDGYSHDAQCVNYNGPDQKYVGREICFSYNEDTLTIYDVTDKVFPHIVSRVPYVNATYTHQGWLTEDQRYILMNDELDEYRDVNAGFTQTLIWDVSDLANPKHFSDYYSPVTSIDHNIYISGWFSYQSNYASGLRINDLSAIDEGVLKEVAYFDVRPEDDSIQFFGTWSNYPYFKSGVVAVSSIERGLFLLKPTNAGMPPLSPAIEREITIPPTVLPTEPVVAGNGGGSA